MNEQASINNGDRITVPVRLGDGLKLEVQQGHVVAIV
jgi:hypothetical protein